ncbi:MAG: hypothetical protein IPO21_18395 [Bacteroidales bacterium]|nr:hypothetical protein [Bacteroidales bacterium]
MFLANFSCDAPLVVNATSTASNQGETVYNWDFGNGAISSKINPDAVTYSDKGNYAIKLTTQLGANCSDVKIKNVQVGAFDPLITMYYGIISKENIIQTNQVVPIGIVHFKNNTNDTLKYKWTINGVDYVNTNPRVVFCSQGEYQVALTVGTDLACPSTATKVLRVANSNNSFISIFQNDQLVLDTANTGSIEFRSPYIGAENKWNFHGKTLFGDKVSFDTCVPGAYTIELISAFDKDCVDTLRRNFIVSESNDSSIVIRQDGITYLADKVEICDGTMTFATKSPLFSNAVWTIGGKTYLGSTVTAVICKPENLPIKVEGFFYNNCKIKSSRSIKVNLCANDESFKLARIIQGQELEVFDNDTICVGNEYYVEPKHKDHFINWTFEVLKRGGVDFVTPKKGDNLLGMITKKTNGCIDTITKKVFGVNVIADFSLKNAQFNCVFPLETDFYNKSQNATAFQWRVQYISSGDTIVDSIFAKIKSPHLSAHFPYHEIDKYRHWIDTTKLIITLDATSSYGCGDKKRLDVIKRMPLARFTPSIKWGCAPLSVDFESQDEPGFDFIDSVFILNPYTSKIDTALRRRYNEIVSLYWDFGDGTPIIHTDSAELSTFLSDVKKCYTTSIGSSGYILSEIARYEREQKGYGVLFYISQLLKNIDIDAYKVFKECWKNQKHLSSRMQNHIYTKPEFIILN